MEDYPQYWDIPQFDKDWKLFDSMQFCLDRDDEGKLFVRRFGENDTREQDEIPVKENLVWLQEHLHRLHKLKNSLKKNDSDSMKLEMPSYEWETAWAYHDAMLNAISTVIETVTGDASLDDLEGN